jgi:hypothetical protein
MHYGTISSGMDHYSRLHYGSEISQTLRYSCEQILESSAACFLDLTGTLREKGMSYWVALSEFSEISRLVSSFKEYMLATWTEGSLRTSSEPPLLKRRPQPTFIATIFSPMQGRRKLWWVSVGSSLLEWIPLARDSCPWVQFGGGLGPPTFSRAPELHEPRSRASELE